MQPFMDQLQDKVKDVLSGDGFFPSGESKSSDTEK